MKITNVKFYQAIVVFDGIKGRTITHLNLDSKTLSCEYEMSVKEGIGLLIDTPHGGTLVTFNNIAFLQIEKEAKVAAKPAKK